MKSEHYLKRIGIDEIKIPSLEFLTELQHRHLLSIPFEDLDIPDTRIELDLEKIYKKIIPTKRGGFCYELNGLFHWLLTSLNFKVDMLSARVYNDEKLEFGPEYDHMVLLVHLNKDYIADVGFGDSFRLPVEIPDGEVKDVSGAYKVFQKVENGFELHQKNENGWMPQYSFSTEAKKFDDYRNMCSFQQDSPTSHFRTRMLCTIATETGRITLSNSSLTITEDKTKSKTEINNKDEFNIMLKKYFGIEL
ncbi:MAG: arylamine N-acetyltransferase [Ignavibacteriales bacterium]